MRSRSSIPQHLLTRLLMAVVLLVGMAVAVSPGMAANATHGILAHTEAHQHHCCEPAAAEPACAAACSAMTCATPILPGLVAALFVSRDATASPHTTLFLCSRGPELETPPPRA